MPWEGFEPTIPSFEQAKTVHALDCAATVIGDWGPTVVKFKGRNTLGLSSIIWTRMGWCNMCSAIMQLPYGGGLAYLHRSGASQGDEKGTWHLRYYWTTPHKHRDMILQVWSWKLCKIKYCCEIQKWNRMFWDKNLPESSREVRIWCKNGCVCQWWIVLHFIALRLIK
jgi:hypothetical protein